MKSSKFIIMAVLCMICFSACKNEDNPSQDNPQSVPDKGKLVYTIQFTDTEDGLDYFLNLTSYYDKNVDCDIFEYSYNDSVYSTIILDKTQYCEIDAPNILVVKEENTEPFSHIFSIPEDFENENGLVKHDNGMMVSYEEDGCSIKLTKVEPLTIDIEQYAKDLISSAKPYEPKVTRSEETSSFMFADWMKTIPDSTPLNNITLPGTHDSGTKYTSLFIESWGKCQSRQIDEQLKIGIRLLDIRLGNYKGEMTLFHGDYRCLHSEKHWFLNNPDPLKFKDVLDMIEKFLKEHPSETVVIHLKKENGDGWSDEFWREKGMKEMTKRGDLCFFDETRIPTLGEVRGKIVVISRNTPMIKNENFCAHFSDWPDKVELFETSMGTGENQVNFFGSDKYSYYVDYWGAYFGKWMDVKKIFDEYSYYDRDSEKKGLVTFTSGTGVPLTTPLTIAETVNFFMGDYEFKDSKCYGWIFMDFVYPDLIQHIIEPYLVGWNEDEEEDY